MNNQTVSGALGISEERANVVFEIVEKSFRESPDHSSSLLALSNCSELNDTERMFAIFSYGKISGVGEVLHRLDARA